MVRYRSIYDINIEQSNIEYKQIKTYKGETVEERQTLLEKTRKSLTSAISVFRREKQASNETLILVNKYMKMDQITYFNIKLLVDIVMTFFEGENLANVDNTKLLIKFIINESNKFKIMSIGKKNKTSYDSENFTTTVIRYIYAIKDFLGEEKEVGREIQFYDDIDIVVTPFLDMVTNDEILSSFLYMEEANDPFGVKKRMKLHYHNLFETVNKYSVFNNSQIEFNFNVMKNAIQRRVTIDSGDEMITYKDDKYLKVNISNANNIEDIEKFIKVIKLCIDRYQKNKDWVMDSYTKYISIEDQEEISNEILMVNEKEKVKKVAEKLLNIKEATKEYGLIPRGYARKVAGGYPTLISEEEIEEWEEGGYQVMEFNLDFPDMNSNNVLYFVCEDEKKSNPGVIVNTLDNRRKYPYLPKCFDIEQLENKNSVYQLYRRGENPNDIREFKNQPTTKITKVGTVLDAGRIGKIPKTLENMMYMIENVEPLRLGVVRSKSSLLHCVLTSINYKTYMKLELNKEKETFVRKMRKKITSKIFPGLLKQELYDMDDDEILSNIKNENVYLDPSLYYRALEEYFDINIYVFEPIEVVGTRGKNVEIAKLKLPRYNIYHSRSMRKDREVVLIYVHSGGEAQGLEYPQCELIINKEYYVFEDKANDVCFEILKRTLSTITFDDGKGINIYYEDFIKHLRSSMELTLIEQFIDDRGKMIGVNAVIGNSEDNVRMTVAFPPIQPLNLRVVNDGTIYSLDKDMVETLIKDKPTSVTNGGYWYEYQGIENSVFIPVKKVKGNGAKNPLLDGKLYVTDTMNKYSHMSNILKGLLIWIYIVDKKLISKDNVVYDESILYDFSGSTCRLPDITNRDKAVRYIQGITNNTLINEEGKLVMRNKDMFAKLIFNVNQWKKLKEKKLKYIPDFYNRIQDFKQYKDSSIFDGDTMYEWIQTLSPTENTHKIYNVIGIVHSVIKVPFLYRYSDNTMMLIYNTIDLNEAAKMALMYIGDNGTNKKKFKNFKDIDVNYIIYQPNDQGKLDIVIDKKIKDKEEKEGDTIYLLTYEYGEIGEGEIDYEGKGAMIVMLN